MSQPFEYAPNFADTTVPPDAYGVEYYSPGAGQLYRFFDFRAYRDVPRADAMAAAIGLRPGDTVLDFGCGPGVVTAAFNAAGYPTVGVDTSPHAIACAIPEAQGRIKYLGSGLSLSDFPNDMVDLVIAKEVFEHLPESEIHEIVDQLTCIGRQVLAVIPTTDEKGSFLYDPYNRDRTHVTRLTAALWLGRFAYGSVRSLEDIAERICREDRTPGTMCLLLEETNREMRKIRMEARNLARARGPIRRRLFKSSSRRSIVDFADLLVR